MKDNSSAMIKKELESINLNYFIESYYELTGSELLMCVQQERPDFICQFPNDQKVGIELTKLMRDPRDKHWDSVLDGREFISADKALDNILNQILSKNDKLKENDWRFPNNTILLVELYAISIAELKPMLTAEYLSDAFSLNFREIWLGDYTQVEPFDSVDIFCIAPENMFGRHSNLNQNRKPYG